MKHLCIVQLEETKYHNSEWKPFYKLHKVVAETEIDAEIKVNNHYRAISDIYGTSYRVLSVEFTETIK